MHCIVQLVLWHSGTLVAWVGHTHCTHLHDLRFIYLHIIYVILRLHIIVQHSYLIYSWYNSTSTLLTHGQLEHILNAHVLSINLLLCACMGVDTVYNVGGGLMIIVREARENFLLYY